MKVKDLLNVLLMDQKVIITYIEDGEILDERGSVWMVKTKEHLSDLEVSIMYYSENDKSYHIVTAHP